MERGIMGGFPSPIYPPYRGWDVRDFGNCLKTMTYKEYLTPETISGVSGNLNFIL